MPLAARARVARRTRARCPTRRPPRRRRAATSTAWRRATPRARCASGSPRSPRASSIAMPAIVEFADGMVDGGGQDAAVRGARARGVLRARAAVGHRLLCHAEDPLRPQDAERPAVLLLRVRRRGVGSRGRHADRRAPAARASTSCTTSARSLNPAIDLGQIEGGFIQGWGWLAMEELWWNDKGELDDARAVDVQDSDRRTTGPARFRVDFFDEPNREDTIYRSKAVGEPPFMLALSAFHALRDAIASVGGYRLAPRLDAPATDERILRGRRGHPLRRAQARMSMTRAGSATLAGTRVAARRPRGARHVAARDRLDAARGRARAMVVTRGRDRRHDRRRPSRVRGDRARARRARAATPAPALLVRFPLAARLGQCCGGVATLAFAVVDARRRAWLDAAQRCERTRRVRARHRVGAAATAQRLVVTADDARGTLGDCARLRGDRRGARAPRAGGATRPRRRRRRDARSCTSCARTRFHVVLFGNGHVGRALVRVLGALPAACAGSTRARRDFPADVPANVEVVATDAPEANSRERRAARYVVVMTHSHPLDFELVECGARARRLGAISA